MSDELFMNIYGMGYCPGAADPYFWATFPKMGNWALATSSIGTI